MTKHKTEFVTGKLTSQACDQFTVRIKLTIEIHDEEPSVEHVMEHEISAGPIPLDGNYVLEYFYNAPCREPVRIQDRRLCSR